MTAENAQLTSALVSSREEISRLSQLVGAASVVGGPGDGAGAGGGGGGAPVSMNVSLTSAAKVVAASSVRPGGYGY